MRDKVQAAIDQAKACYMSNAKWRLLFSLAAESGFEIFRSKWKFLGDDRIFEEVGLPKTADLLEERFTDGLWQPVQYKSIEYISIPKYCENPRQDAKRPLPKIKQPIDELADYLGERAKFPLRLSATELRIQAYEI